MMKLGTIDLEILQLAIKEGRTFNETNLEKSALKRLGVGRLLDSLASLKDRGLISLNQDGSFSITDPAKEILWSANIPTWVKILRLLQIKSCDMEQIADILRLSKEELLKNIEKLRANQFVLMSPQRQDERIVRVYEILPEGSEEIDKTDSEGFYRINVEESKAGIEILGIIDEIAKEIRDSEINQVKKEIILEKLFKLKEKLEVQAQ